MASRIWFQGITPSVRPWSWLCGEDFAVPPVVSTRGSELSLNCFMVTSSCPSQPWEAFLSRWNLSFPPLSQSLVDFLLCPSPWTPSWLPSLWFSCLTSCSVASPLCQNISYVLGFLFIARISGFPLTVLLYGFCPQKPALSGSHGSPLARTFFSFSSPASTCVFNPLNATPQIHLHFFGPAPHSFSVEESVDWLQAHSGSPSCSLQQPCESVPVLMASSVNCWSLQSWVLDLNGFLNAILTACDSFSLTVFIVTPKQQITGACFSPSISPV